VHPVLTEATAEQLWASICSLISTSSEYAQLCPWIPRIRFSVIDGCAVTDLSDRTLSDLFVSPLPTLLHAAVHQVIGSQIAFKFLVPEEKNKSINSDLSDVDTNIPENKNTEHTQSEHMNHINVHTNDEVLTFESFYVGPSNRLACAAAREIAHRANKTYSPLFVHAQTGLGKSLLIKTIYSEYRKQYPDKQASIYNCEDFSRQLITYRESMLTSLQNMDLLIIDDIHQLEPNSQIQADLTRIIDHMRSNGKNIIFSSLLHPTAMSFLNRDLSSRLQWGLVIEIDAPTAILREQMILSFIKKYHIQLEEKSIRLLTESSSLNLRELEGILLRIVGQSHLLGQSIHYQDIQAILTGSVQTNGFPVKMITLEMIENVVCNYFGLKKDDLQSRSRTRSIAYPRQVAMYLAKTMTSSSLEEIGRYFGGRDHSTVKHGCEKVHTLVENDQTTKQMIQQCEQVIMKK